MDDPTEDQGEDAWDSTHGAIFLANIDDDLGACPETDGQGRALSDYDLPKCNDAANNAVDGDDDLLDLAPLRIRAWPGAPAGAQGGLKVSSPGANNVRFFRFRQGKWTYFDFSKEAFRATDLQAGVELRLEGKDVVRSGSSWDGFAEITLEVAASPDGGAIFGADTVRMRVSPIMTFHHLLDPETVYATALNDPDSEVYRKGLETALTQSGLATPLVSLAVDDQWTQDFFEPAFMSMPGPQGTQHAIRVNLRSANVYSPGYPSPLRAAGKVVFTGLRGKEVAGVQEFDVNSNPDMDTLNSMGNTETIPPYSFGGASYPLGRLLRGSVSSFHPDAKFAAMLAAQKIQPPVLVDTSWLLVAHVDETIAFVKADTPRGWAVLAADPALAKSMLESQVAQGNGDVKMFVGMYAMDDWGNEFPAERTLSAVLADTAIMAVSANAAVEIDAQLAILKSATGVTDSEIVRLPFLFERVSGLAVAYQPGTVNGIVLANKHFGAPELHGPVIGGSDIMKAQAEAALGTLGFAVDWIENWNLYHRLSGEVHCGSNTARKIPEARWWESGR